MATQRNSVSATKNNSHFQPWHSHSTFKATKNLNNPRVIIRVHEDLG